VITSANIDAREEIRHADCAALARATMARGEGPRRIPRGAHAAHRAAQRTLMLDDLGRAIAGRGALHRSLSAQNGRAARKRTDDLAHSRGADRGGRTMRQPLAKRVGCDRVVHRRRGRADSAALRGAADALQRATRSICRRRRFSMARWEQLWDPGAQLEIEEHAKARAELSRRVNALELPLAA